MQKLLCTKCRKIVCYHIEHNPAKVMVKDVEIEYEDYRGVCDECGSTIYVPGLDDKYIAVIEQLYHGKIK